MSDTSVRRHRAVLCLFCNQPIDLPAIVSRLEEENRNENMTEQFGARVFQLRCGTCAREYPYSADAIVEIEGTPGRQFSSEIARAAHAS